MVFSQKMAFEIQMESEIKSFLLFLDKIIDGIER